MSGTDERCLRGREFLKDSLRTSFDFARTDQNRGVAPPPLQKPYDAAALTLDLPGEDAFPDLCAARLLSVLRSRRSVRRYANAPLALAELAFLLWATQGVSARQGDLATLRPVPSAGARHALETYVFASRVEGLPPALYRYLPLEHRLLFEFEEPGFGTELVAAALGQGFIGRAAAVFLWSAIPYRMEWRYGPAAHRTLALDAGHVCQNLYLAAEALGAGACAVGAYDQARMDALLRLDGVDEFLVYLAPVGKKPSGRGEPAVGGSAARQDTR